IYFHGDDRRACDAKPGDALHRVAVYAGSVDSLRLHRARKLSDTYYVGPADHERRDRRVEYQRNDRIARTILFYYDGDVRAAACASGARLHREVCFSGSPK